MTLNKFNCYSISRFVIYGAEMHCKPLNWFKLIINKMTIIYYHTCILLSKPRRRLNKTLAGEAVFHYIWYICGLTANHKCGASSARIYVSENTPHLL